MAERVALNDASFREANEQIEETADRLEMEGLLPFLCECSDTSCTQLLLLTRAEYEAVRSDSTHFLAAAGHESSNGWVEIIETYDRFVVVAKKGDAAAVATDKDPRREGAT